MESLCSAEKFKSNWIKHVFKRNKVELQRLHQIMFKCLHRGLPGPPSPPHAELDAMRGYQRLTPTPPYRASTICLLLYKHIWGIFLHISPFPINSMLITLSRWQTLSLSSHLAQDGACSFPFLTQLGFSGQAPHNPLWPVPAEIAALLFPASARSRFHSPLTLTVFLLLFVGPIHYRRRERLISQAPCLSEGSSARLAGPAQSRKANDWNSALELIFFSVHIILPFYNLIYNIISYSCSKAEEPLSWYVHIFLSCQVGFVSDFILLNKEAEVTLFPWIEQEDKSLLEKCWGIFPNSGS